jgi:hypothetical protein
MAQRSLGVIILWRFINRRVHAVDNKLEQYEQKRLIMSAGWKTSDTQNNSLTIDLLENEDLGDC